MPLWMLALGAGLAVQFGGGGAWTTRPSARILVTARGAVCPEALRTTIEDLKITARILMRSQPSLDAAEADDVAVEIKRVLAVDDEDAIISASITMAMVTGACMSS